MQLWRFIFLSSLSRTKLPPKKSYFCRIANPSSPSLCFLRIQYCLWFGVKARFHRSLVAKSVRNKRSQFLSHSGLPLACLGRVFYDQPLVRADDLDLEALAYHLWSKVLASVRPPLWHRLTPMQWPGEVKKKNRRRIWGWGDFDLCGRLKCQKQDWSVWALVPLDSCFIEFTSRRNNQIQKKRGSHWGRWGQSLPRPFIHSQPFVLVIACFILECRCV